MKDDKKGIVYLLGDWARDGVYKIGVTRGDIEKRVKKLQTGNSGEIYICQKYETIYPFFLEKTLHSKYLPYKIKNEWFGLNDEQVIDFKKECKEIEDMIEALKDNPFFHIEKLK